MKKFILSFSFVALLGASFLPMSANAGCYDVTYPSNYCDPQGHGSCTRICCETQNCPVQES